jgi:prevent-host-death family protein
MESVVTATEAARRLSDLLNRVWYRNESFVIVRGGEEVARLVRVGGRSPVTLAQAVNTAVAHRSGDPLFANDLESIQLQQPPPGDGPWAS